MRGLERIPPGDPIRTANLKGKRGYLPRHLRLVSPPHAPYSNLSDILTPDRSASLRRPWTATSSAPSATNPKVVAPAKNIAPTARGRRVSGSASTASIIARIAVRLAKCRLRKAMVNETTQVSLRLGGDPRLVAAVGTAVEFQAGQAGLEAERSSHLAKATVDVCREALSQLAEIDGGLDIRVKTFADRIEISIEHHGLSAPAVGLDAFTVPSVVSEGYCGVNGMELLERVDRVTFDSLDGIVRTTLVKFLEPSAESSPTR